MVLAGAVVLILGTLSFQEVPDRRHIFFIVNKMCPVESQTAVALMLGIAAEMFENHWVRGSCH